MASGTYGAQVVALLLIIL